MAFEMKIYKVTFTWHGKLMWEVITATSMPNVYMIIEQRYPGASGLGVYEA